MLMNEMRDSLKSKLETIINVDDHLIDYKTRLIRKEKFSFCLEFINFRKFDSIAGDFANIQIINEISEIKESVSVDDFQIQSNNQHKDLTKYDFISFLKLFAEFALKHFLTKENEATK